MLAPAAYRAPGALFFWDHFSYPGAQDREQIRRTQTPRGLVLKINGDIDGDSADDLDRQLRIVAELKPALVVIDLSECAFVASVGMGVLIRFQQMLAPGGGKVVLAGARPLVR